MADEDRGIQSDLFSSLIVVGPWGAMVGLLNSVSENMRGKPASFH